MHKTCLKDKYYDKIAKYTVDEGLPPTLASYQQLFYLKIYTLKGY